MIANTTLNTLLLIATGSSTGALVRYLVGQAMRKVNDDSFPWGTWIVNVLGSLLLSMLSLGFSPGHLTDWKFILGSGFCGGFTTFSTMSAEAVSLFRSRPTLCIIYLGSSLAFGFVLAWAAQWWF